MEPEVKENLPLSENQPSNPSHKPIYKNKVFLSFVAISFIVAFLVGGLAIAPKFNKQSQTLTPQVDFPEYKGEITQLNNKSVYTNNKLGYSFSYPLDWTLKEEYYPNNLGKLGVRISPSVKPCPTNVNPFTCEVSESIYIGVIDNSGNLTVDKYLEEYVTSDPLPVFTTIYLDGFKAQKTTELPGRFESTDIFVNKEKKIYQISLTKANFAKKISENEFNEFLSSFKFTDSSGGIVNSTPTPTCIPRPNCLDSIPRCMIAETENMCPPSPTQ